MPYTPRLFSSVKARRCAGPCTAMCARFFQYLLGSCARSTGDSHSAPCALGPWVWMHTTECLCTSGAPPRVAIDAPLPLSHRFDRGCAQRDALTRYDLLPNPPLARSVGPVRYVPRYSLGAPLRVRLNRQGPPWSLCMGALLHAPAPFYCLACGAARAFFMHCCPCGTTPFCPAFGARGLWTASFPAPPCT